MAIAFADVVGCSTLMAADENATDTRWIGLLRPLIEPETERRRGRIVDLASDGVPAVFSEAGETRCRAQIHHLKVSHAATRCR